MTWLVTSGRCASLDEAERYIRTVSAPFGPLTDAQWRHLTVHVTRAVDGGGFDLLRAAGASGIEAVATHALASPADMARMADAGITRIRATDATTHPAATIPLAGILTDAIRGAGWLETP